MSARTITAALVAGLALAPAAWSDDTDRWHAYAPGSAFGLRVQPPELVSGGEDEEHEEGFGHPWFDRLTDSDAAGGGRFAGPVYDSKNTDGQAGSGARGVVYHASGKPVDAGAAALAPDALLWRTGYGSWEPTLGLLKDGTIFFSARNTNVDPGVARSRDGGRTWEEASPLQHEISLDPYVWVDTATGRVFANDIEASVTCPPFSYSDDAGATWTTSTVCGQFDHQTVFGGPPPAGAAAPQGYPNVVYYCAISGGALADSSTISGCSRSLDGGLTFTPTESLPYPPRPAPEGYDYNPWCDGALGHGVVDDKGTIYLARGWCSEPYIAISHDEGATWEQIRLPGENLSPGAHEANVAVDRDGTVFVTWMSEKRRVLLVHSRDGGQTWRGPVDATPPGVSEATLPNIAVGDPGRVALTFVAGTNRPDAKPEEKTWNGYVVMSTDATAADPVFYAATVNDPADPLWRGDDCGTLRCGNIGDFLDVVVAQDGTPLAAMVDSCPTDGGKTCTGFDVHLPRGEAIMGQLVGGPPLIGTIAQQTPGVALPAQPATPACRARKPLRIALRRPRRGRIVSAVVYVNGKRVKRLRGRRIPRRVTVRRLPVGRAVVRVVVRSSTGRKVTRTRTYRTCG